MISRPVNLAVLASLVAAGALGYNQSAQAITLTPGDVLNVAGELTLLNDALFFDFGAPSGASAGSNFIVTGATGGFAPFADPSNANGPLPSPPNFYTINDLDISVFSQDGSLIPFNSLNNLTNGVAAPLFDCPGGVNCRAITPAAFLPFLELEIGDSDLSPDLIIELVELDFLGGFPLGGGNTQNSASGTLRYIADNVTIGSGSFNATFNDSLPNGPTSYSLTLTVDAEDVPETSSVVALAAMAGMGALSLRKKSKNFKG